MAGASAEALAEASARALWEDDLASQSVGIVIENVGPGEATLSLLVRQPMANGHGTCHGGYIFMLADSALGYACNSYNQRAVAHVCNITYLHPARVGDRLVARAEERARAGRTGIYDVTVRTETGVIIAEFRGQSRTISGKLVRDS